MQWIAHGNSKRTRQGNPEKHQERPVFMFIPYPTYFISLSEER